jgi:hypothetical protein
MTAPPSVERIEVTPELARAWIYHSARAPRRHDLHDDKVSRFAKAMAAANGGRIEEHQSSSTPMEP